MSNSFVRVSAAQQLVTEDHVTDPVVPAGHVEIAVTYCGVCGSDVHNFADGDVYPRAVFGHEWTGTVSDLAGDVTDLAVGDRVVVAVGAPCGACAMCDTGHPDHCETVFLESNGMAPDSPTHGAYATSITMPRRRVMRVLDGVSDEQAALVEPTAVTFHAVRRTRQQLGDVVLVQGAGPIGLLTAQHARHAGAGHVLVVEPNETRRATAATLGFTDVLAPGPQVRERLDVLTQGLGADVVYECTGVASLLQPAAELVRRGGTLSLLGFASEPSTISSADWLMRELRVLSSLTYLREDFIGSMRAIADGSIDVRPLITGTFGLDDLAGLLTDLGSGSSAHAKVLIDPRR